MGIDFEGMRDRFPLLRERIYCDNQCMGCFPQETLTDLDDYRATLFLRSRALAPWTNRKSELYDLFHRLLNAPPGSVAIRDSATAAQGAIAAALEPKGERRRIVIAPNLDFGSSRFLWTSQAQRGFEIVAIANDWPTVRLEEALRLIDERTAVVALPFVSPRSGALLPVREIAAHARAVGAITVVDTYQAVGVVPIDVTTLGADVVVGGTHKWLYAAGTGIAFLYVAPELSPKLPVLYPGWWGHAGGLNPDPGFIPDHGALKFQQGTFAVEGIYTARGGLRFVLEAGVDAIRARTLALTERFRAAAVDHKLRITTPFEDSARAAIVVVDVPDPDRVVTELDHLGIDIDTRPGVGLRVGPHPCLSLADCERVATEIARVVQAHA